MQRLTNFFVQAGCFVSRTMNVHVSLNGYTVLSKATIATMKCGRHFFKTTYFDDTIKNFEFHKDLLYATLFFQNAGDFIRKTVTNNANGTRTVSYSLQCPGRDWYDKIIRITQAVGNFLEMIQCSMKWIFGTPLALTRVGHRLGSKTIPLFDRKFDRFPVLMTLVNKPKDFFIFVSDAMTVARMIYKFVQPASSYDGVGKFARFGYGQNNFEFADNVCKFTSSLGKMILISTGPFYGEYGRFRCVDFVTQWASEVKFVVGHERKRSERLANF
jgi:hypothetical protein